MPASSPLGQTDESICDAQNEFRELRNVEKILESPSLVTTKSYEEPKKNK